MDLGSTVGDRYRILQAIGKGGSATVYQVEDLVDGGFKALKLIHVVDPSVREGLCRRLLREARILRELDHPNVLTVHDVGTFDDRAYMVSELAASGLVERLRQQPADPEEIVHYMLQVLSALAVAHEAGVVHRDVKPQNILISEEGRVVLADFGIAMADNEQTRQTRIGSTMGSFSFMPPEQRLDARSVDHRADLYSAGSTLYHLLTGKKSVDLFLDGPKSARMSGLPPALRSVVLRSTRHRPEDRFQDAQRMAGALYAALPAARALSTGAYKGDRELGSTHDETRQALDRLGEAFADTTLDIAPPMLARSPLPDAKPTPPVPDDEAERLAALLSLNVLDTPPEERFDRHTRMAQRLFGVQIALVSLVDKDRQWFKSRQGLDATETPRELAFCAHAILEPDRLFEINDATQDPRFRGNPLVEGSPDIRFYAGMPIRGADNQPVGTLCIIDKVPRTLDDDERTLLRDVAGMVEDELKTRRRPTIDSETGLSDREGFAAQSRRALASARRKDQPVTLLYVSVDDPGVLASTSPASMRGFADTLLESWPQAEVFGRVAKRDFAVILPHDADIVEGVAGMQSRAPSSKFRWATTSVLPDCQETVASLVARAEQLNYAHLEERQRSTP